MKRLALLLLPVFALMTPYGTVSAQTLQTPITGPATVTLQQVQTITAGTPLAPFAQEIIDFGAQYNINPAFALAIWTHESSLDTAGASVANNNPGNLICAAAHRPPALPTCNGRWAVYPDLSAAIADWYHYIHDFYIIGRGLTTVETIMPIYAPPTENDTAAYIAQVVTLMQKWGAGQTTAPPQTTAQPGWLDSFLAGALQSWVVQPAYWVYFELLHLVATLLWAFNKAGFANILAMARFEHTLVASTFRPLIDRLSASIGLALPPVIIVALMLAGLTLTLRLWANVTMASPRKVILVALIAPFVLTFAGAWYQDLEQMRLDTGASLYQIGWGSTQGPVPGTQGPPTPGQATMGALVPLDPTLGTQPSGRDVAAAYLFATLGDIQPTTTLSTTTDLPVTFAQVYFPKDPWDLAGEDQQQRAASLSLSIQGVARMFFGVGMVAFAWLEGLSNLLWSLAFGFLVVALIIASLLMWFPPVEHIAASLGRRMLSLWLCAWSVSIVQGVFLAILYGFAASNNAGAVLGFAIVGCFVLLVCTILAAYCFGGALLGTMSAMSHGMADVEHARMAGHLMGAGALAATGGASAAVTGVTTKLGEAAKTAMTYRAVRGMQTDEGDQHSPLYAATYALADPQKRPKLLQAGFLANAMGFELPQDMEQALHTRAAAGQRNPLGPQAHRAVRRDLTPPGTTGTNGASRSAPSAQPVPPIIYAPTINAHGSNINSPAGNATYTQKRSARPRYQPKKPKGQPTP